ncbi:phosphatidylinositol glycan anchor biosynthesis class F [Tachypleus tridentatus]|uniref:phosphatidylinositol glycan anchor biosynthesis class F n=1 Tax=Tachypleus tridentatus TaxID=6853 RepID=UPI003FD38395
MTRLRDSNLQNTYLIFSITLTLYIPTLTSHVNRKKAIKYHFLTSKLQEPTHNSLPFVLCHSLEVTYVPYLEHMVVIMHIVKSFLQCHLGGAPKRKVINLGIWRVMFCLFYRKVKFLVLKSEIKLSFWNFSMALLHEKYLLCSSILSTCGTIATFVMHNIIYGINNDPTNGVPLLLGSMTVVQLVSCIFGRIGTNVKKFKYRRRMPVHQGQRRELNITSDKQHNEYVDVFVKYLSQFGSTFQIMTFLTVSFYIIAVLFGAPLFHDIIETVYFSLLLSVLVGIPLCFLIEPSIHALCQIILQRNYHSIQEIHCLNLVYGSLVGAWVGAVAIPLDWDRPWQKWPFPCCVGALAGNFGGNIISLPLIVKNVLSKKKKHF